jgi:glycosyltransferase involved in cell wall biosynthesis
VILAVGLTGGRAGISRVTLEALFLTCHLPYPPVSGGRLREFELLRRISPAVDVHLCAVSKTYEADLAAASGLDDICASVTVLPAASANGSPPAQVLRHRCPDAARHVGSLLRNGEIDVVHVEGFYLMQHVPALTPAPVVLVEQNVEYSLWAQRLALAATPEERRTMRVELAATREHELLAWRRATICAAVTADDRAEMVAALPDLDVRVVPDGPDHLPPAGHGSSTGATIVFVGNFAYQPNEDAARWLCTEIFPRIRARVPGARVRLVGVCPPPDVLALSGDGVEVTGHVPSVEPHLDEAAVVVAPLRVGGGVKVKVLEALSRGKAVVSTSVGIQGLPQSPAVVADEPAAFATAVAELLADPAAREQREQAALRYARSLPTWDDAARALLGCYRAARRAASGRQPNDLAAAFEAPAA